MNMKKINNHTNRHNIYFIISQLKWVVIVGTLLLFNQVLFSFEYYVITDPTPTQKEGNAAYLQEVRALGEELGNGQYLFAPFSITADKNNVFVYDRAQVKVFRFTPDLKLQVFFGRGGQAPGEFYSRDRLDALEIAIGNDGNFYVNNFSAGRMIGLDRQGKQLKSYYYGDFLYVNKPTADKNGNVLFVFLKDGRIEIQNEKKMILAQGKSEKVHYGFLYEGPGKNSKELYARQKFPPETSWTLTIDGKLLILFSASATVAIFNGKEYERTLKLWPQGALERYKKYYHQEKKKKEDMFSPMFFSLIVDQDNRDIFYVQERSDYSQKKNSFLLYAFDLAGRLLKVIHVPIQWLDGDPYFPRIQAKVNHTFYATRGGEEIVMYKEKTK